ncbi:Hypothetical predicted protein [Olea europaea subsp. europaea]|uniref:Uncharacterized protein n=1 Tax=Olea europaea subsp. europaea TaxID=158383 RepID=A0A8S0U385_OLEEU|nr:Hypothetical predicted protein [Olea europaea subsp. europaea]
MSTVHLSPFSQPLKKLRLPQHPDFPLNGQFRLSTFFSGQFLGSGNTFSFLPENTPAGMQGARHAQYSLSLSDLYLSKLKSGFFPVDFLPPDQTALHKACFNQITTNSASNKNVSCLQTMGNSIPASKNSDNGKTTPFLLFGQPMLTEQQI